MNMSKSKNTHSEILSVLNQCRDNVVQECVASLNDKCVLNVTAMHGLYGTYMNQRPGASVADQKVVTEAMRKVLKLRGLDVKSEKAAKGAKGRAGVTRYLSLGLDAACIGDARQHVAAALSPPVNPGSEEQLLEAENKRMQLQEELAASKQTAAGLLQQVQALQFQLANVCGNEA